MVSPATTNGHRIAALVEPETPEIVSIDGRRCLRVTGPRPYTDIRAFERGSIIRPVSVARQPHLCVMVKMRLITLLSGEQFIEANVFSVSFWSPQEADLFWSLQLCITQQEAEACEDAALLMV